MVSTNVINLETKKTFVTNLSNNSQILVFKFHGKQNISIRLKDLTMNTNIKAIIMNLKYLLAITLQCITISHYAKQAISL